MGVERLSIKLVATLAVLVFVGKSFGEEVSQPCTIKLENEEKQQQVFQDCVKQIKPKVAKNYPNATSDEEAFHIYFDNVMKEKAPDDLCFMECVLSHLDIISSDGQLEKNKFLTQFKSNASAAYTEAMFGVWKSCADKTVELAKPDGGFKNNSCKFSAKLLHCAFTEGAKLTQKEC